MRFVMIGLALMATGAILVGCERDGAEAIPFEPDFVELVEAGKVDRVTILHEPSGVTHITGWTKPMGSPGKKFRVEVLDSDGSVLKFLGDSQVAFDLLSVRQEPEQWHFMPLVPILVLIAICVAIVVFVLTLAVRLVRAVERIAENSEK